MSENLEVWAKMNCKCCTCGGDLGMSESLNYCVTKKIATWKCPVFGPVNCPWFPGRAVAFLCDECVEKERKVLFAIEFEEGQPPKYHALDSLESEADYLGKQNRLKMLRLAAARQVGEN